MRIVKAMEKYPMYREQLIISKITGLKTEAQSLRSRDRI